MSKVPTAAVTINGRPLTDTQSEVLRVALIVARREMNDSLVFQAAGILMHVNRLLAIFDETVVTL